MYGNLLSSWQTQLFIQHRTWTTFPHCFAVGVGAAAHEQFGQPTTRPDHAWVPAFHVTPTPNYTDPVWCASAPLTSVAHSKVLVQLDDLLMHGPAQQAKRAQHG